MNQLLIRVLLVYWCIPWFPASADEGEELELFDKQEPRSRMVMINGNMFFHAGYNRNITFVAQGAGSIFLGGVDISHLPSLAIFDELAEEVEVLNHLSEIAQIKFNSLTTSLFAVANITRTLVTVSRNISMDVNMLKEWKKDRVIKDVKMRRYINKIIKGLKVLMEALNTDGCADKPCKGGATCIPRIGKFYFCLCPPHRTGANCESDINECEVFTGLQTCQNNATCEDIENGFLCHCPSGFHGPLCQFRRSTCARSPGLCGHGHCIDAVEGDDADYRCICEPGYKVSGDKENPVCVDLNECDTNPCHPGVDCINLPGSFQCSGCPKGFFGNGLQCADIDECSQREYPCSTSPRAPCINTVGSYHCGACPPGYRGDGKTCKRFSPCATRPCYAGANCTDDFDNMNAGGFTCQCPDGYLGDGIGQNGCKKGNSSICKAEGRCLNGGSCKAVTEDSYLCLCLEGYFGSRCEKVSECISTPCKNGATCQHDMTSGYSCICPPGFYGSDCEYEEDTCGQHFTEREGNFTYPDSFGIKAGDPRNCDYIISPPGNNEALRIKFTAFGGMDNTVFGPTECKTAFGNVSLYDGDNDNANLFAVFCGSATSPKAPWIDSPITMTGSRALLRYKGTKGSFSIKWEMRKRECGYRTSVPSGSLAVPTHYQNLSCEWFISAPMDKVVEVTVPPLKLTSLERNCSINQLEVYDGYTAYDSHRVIHFCASSNETVVVKSTGPFMSVFFTNDLLWASDNRLPGFSLHYKFVEPESKCGGEIVNTEGDFEFSGEITSPNYGGLYPNDMHCVWKIDGAPSNTSAAQSLKLEFDEFDLPSPFMFSFERNYRPVIGVYDLAPFGRNRHRRPFIRSMIKCTQDYLHIYSDGNLLFDGCNPHKPPSTMLIPEGKALVQFRSDAKTQGKGFKLKYSMVCEKRLKGNGTIQTWNYPDGGAKGKCNYIITADPTHAIVLKIKTIGLRVANVRECFFTKDIAATVEDYVKLSGGREEEKFINQKYICPKYPFVEEGEFITSASRPLTIEFSSSGNQKNKGLLMEYSTIDVGCGGVFSTNTGTFNSPNYPNKYLAHMHCVYHISVPYPKLVRLNFENFDLEVVQNDHCSYDRIEVYESYVDEAHHGKLLGRFCGSMIPPTLLSSSYSMAIVFISDRSVAGNGFSARYTAVDATSHCDQTFTASSGVISFDGNFGKFTECVYHIALPFNAKILLTVNNMNLPCGKGKLQIKNGADTTSPGFPALYGDSEICDDKPLRSTLRTHGNRAFLKLMLLDPKGVSFNISYEQVLQNCGGRISGVAGSIAAPQYPMKDSRPMECEWIVAVSPGNRVNFQLALVDDLKSSDENGFCGVYASNRLDVLEGSQAGAKMLRRYCRKTLAADTVESDDNEILVRYRQQGGVQFGALFGFLAHFTTDCRNIVLTSLSGTIQSPGYPDPVYTNQFCTWLIMVPYGNRIKVNFHTFAIEQPVTYAYRKYDTCNQNWLKFRPDEIAEATVTLPTGETNTTNSLTETCDRLKPLTLLSTGSVLHINFQSKQKEQNRFWLTWTTIGCGSDIRTESNITVNKNNFGSDVSDVECLWTIKAPIGQKIEFSLKKFLIFRKTQVLGLGRECKWEASSFTGLEIFAGLNNASGIVQEKHCTATKDTINFLSHTNEMFVRMKWSPDSIQTESNGEFFAAEIKFVPTNPDDRDDCGGVVNVGTGGNKTIHSPRFPEEYPRDTHCQWLFKAPPGHHLKFYLKEYTTPNSHPLNEPRLWAGGIPSNLTCQHPMQFIEGALTIFEGNDTRSRIVERICVDIKEPRFIEVDTNRSLVTFQGSTTPKMHASGEEEKPKIGFIMDVRASCGSMEYATMEEQIMRFADMPKSICNVTVRKKNPGESGVKIRLEEYYLKSTISQFYEVGTSRQFQNDEITIIVDGGEPIKRTVDIAALRSNRNFFSHEEFRGEHEIKLSIAKRSSLLSIQIAIAYSSDMESCGTILKGNNGFITTPRLVEDTECIWTLDNNPGNTVSLTLWSLHLPESDNCVESYVEVRKYNDSGPLLERFCVGTDKTFTEEALWIKFRFIKPEQMEEAVEGLTEEDGTPKEYGVKFRYSQRGGGSLSSPGVIMQPKTNFGTSLEYRIQGTEGMGMVFDVESINFPEYNPAQPVYLPSGLYFIDRTIGFLSIVNKMREMANSGSNHALNGWNPPNRFYISSSEVTLYAVGVVEGLYSFKLRWDTIDLADVPNENGTAKTTTDTDICGGKLTPTWEWQMLESPPVPTDGSANTDAGYPSNLHCLWHLTRPAMAGIEIQVIKMDLESVNNCLFDFVTFIAVDEHATDEDDLDHSHKLCHQSDEDEIFSYNYNKRINIHFVSDRNRGGAGFALQYRLACNSFDFIRKDQGVYSATITNPGYPNAALAEYCGWHVVLESNRRLSVTIEELGSSETEGECRDNFITMAEHSSMTVFHATNKAKYCGKPGEPKNFTMKHGRLFVRYVDEGMKNPKGFKMHIEEVLEECTVGEISVDETTPNRTFYTPLWPDLLPNSLDCEYILRAPAGHRLQFTIDPMDFRFEENEDNGTCLCDSCDYVEFRDGATEHSPLIGRYCGTTAPSTITSTDNFLFMKIRTDSYGKSSPFKAELKLAECGGTVVLKRNQTTLLRSPHYPDVYPMHSECEWTVYSPNTHFVQSTVNHIWVSWTQNCTSDRLMIYDGNTSAPYLLPPVCSNQRLEKLDYRSSSSMMTVQFIANSSVPKTSKAFCKDKKCGFELALKVTDEGCGGLLDDNHGTITTPGYPNNLLPNVRCQWDLRAGPGFRYLLEFEFTDPKRNGFYQMRYDMGNPSRSRGCFMDMQFFDGRYQEGRPMVLGQHFFCENQTSHIIESDTATVIYSDSLSRDHKRLTPNAVEDQYYVPFRLNYTRVPAYIDNRGCTYRVTTNQTISFANAANSSSYVADFHYCHVTIIRPEGYETTIITITDYSDEQAPMDKDCSDWASYIEFDSPDDVIQSIYEKICNSSFMGKETSNKLTRVYLNRNVDVHVRTLVNAWTQAPSQKFNLAIEFQRCGGLIEDPNNGVITSNNFGHGNYGPNENCLWQLRAPEGMVVWINITNFDIEQHVTCSADVLIVGEGKGNSVIHRYCNPEESLANRTYLNTMAERHRTVRSHSRYLTLTWHSNAQTQFPGWRIEYEFIDEGDGCGFTTHSITGVVHSPNFPKDYNNADECIWDIQVPVGYHVELKFTHFDIEPSQDCVNDFLQISEEHSARSNEPLGEYYYLFEDEEKKSPMCGIATPAPVDITSNRMRLNFSTNANINAKGFRAEWSAKCGAVFRLSHYEIVSPNYPNNYPNEDMECMYLIQPEGDLAKSIVVLKIQDFDLSPTQVSYGRYPCETDYLEVIDVMNDRVLQVFCGGEEYSEQPIAIRGAVGLRLMVNKTLFQGDGPKRSRGFSATYAMKKCGGVINMMEDSEMIYPIASPAFPLEYPHDLDCLWNITTRGDRVFAIKFHKMEIEHTPDCDLDWVELHEGPQITNTSSLGRFCGDADDMPKSFIKTQGNQMLIHFNSDSSMSKGGFKIIVTATLGPKHGCGGKLEAKETAWTALNPPMTSDGKYANNLLCGWTVQAPDNMMIEFKLEYLDMEQLKPLPGRQQKKETCVDELKIYDGYKAFSPLLVEDLCSSSKALLPMWFHSSHRVAHVSFESDSSGDGRGFSLLYRAVKPSCGGWFTAKEEKQTLPYKSLVTREARLAQTVQRCQWVIQSSDQTPMEITLRDLNISSADGDCSDTFLEIRDVGSVAKCLHPACAQYENAKKVVRYCGQIPLVKFISTTLAVQITTAVQIQDADTSSFTIGYELLPQCNRTIDMTEVPSGRITSPNYPNPYSHNSTCITKLQAPKDHQILLAFHQFRLETGRPIFYTQMNITSRPLVRGRLTYRIPRCDHDYVQVYEGDYKNDTKLHCGAGLPSTVLSSGQNLAVRLETDYSVSTEGYDASYYTVKYNLVSRTYTFAPIYETTGVITSIGYPFGYNDSTVQKFEVLPPPGHTCLIEIPFLSLSKGEEGEECQKSEEYLLIENRDKRREKFEEKLRSCSHKDQPMKFEADSGEQRRLVFTFVSDSNPDNNGIGFRLTWNCHNP